MKKNNKWILIITLLAFVITIIFSVLANLILTDLNLIFGIIVILLFILIGVIFDMVGIAVASVEARNFHSMAARRVKNAHTAIKLTKHSPKVASFCNDVIGDICNIISGASGIIIANNIANKINTSTTLTILIITSIIAALTIGGKALGKQIALDNNTEIVYNFARFLNIVRKK